MKRAFLKILVCSVFFFTLGVLAQSFDSFAQGIQSPQPQSGGKFFRAKGTKAAEDYEREGRPGGWSYEYGRGLRIGPALLKPYLEFETYWDNNVFLEEGGRQEDWINLLRPGITGELPIGEGQHLLAGSYVADIERFNRFDREDHDDHKVQFGGNFNFVPLSLSLQDTFRRTTNRADTEFTSRTSRKENAFHGLMEIPFAAFFLETEVVDYDLDFRLPEQSEFDRHDINVYQRVGFDVAPSTQLLGEYGYSNIDYKSSSFDRDGDANKAGIGLRGYLTERITYQIWGGYQARIYDLDSRPDFHGVTTRGALQFDISEISHVILRGDRRPEESTYDNQSFYVRNRFEIEWKHQIAERLFLSTRELVQYNEYSRISSSAGDDGTRRDYVWQTGVGVEYFMPNELISFLLEYKFRSRDSNTAFLDYDAQTVSLGVKSRF